MILKVRGYQRGWVYHQYLLVNESPSITEFGSEDVHFFDTLQKRGCLLSSGYNPLSQKEVNSNQ
jgi:hypothetical protein